MVQKNSQDKEVFSVIKHGRGKRISLPTKYVKKYDLKAGDRIKIKRLSIEIVSRKEHEEP